MNFFNSGKNVRTIRQLLTTCTQNTFVSAGHRKKIPIGTQISKTQGGYFLYVELPSSIMVINYLEEPSNKIYLLFRGSYRARIKT